MSDAPSWLQEDQVAAAIATNPVAQKAVKNAAQKKVQEKVEANTRNSSDVETGSRSTSTADKAGEFIIEEETLKAMQKWHLALRLCYMSASVLLAAAAALSLQNQKDVGLAFFAFYVFFFSLMICCFEFGLHAIARLIAVNFGFMYTLSGRWIFLFFVGFMSFSLSLFGQIAMAVLYAVGLFHVYIMYKFPRFEEYLRKKHYFEGKNFNQK